MKADSAIETLVGVVRAAETLGNRLLPDGTRLIGAIPHVGPDAWLHVLFPGLKRSEFREVEQSLGGPLPDELRQFYRRFNGLSLFNDALSIFGLRKTPGRSDDAAWQPYSILTPNGPERPPDAPSDAFFFSGYGWDGSLVYVVPSENRIVRCLKSSAKPLNEWADLSEFLSKEAVRLATLFDDKGRRIRASSPTTPI